MDAHLPVGSSVIPQPPTLPYFGNTFTIDRRQPVQSYANLLRKHGPVVRLNLLARDILVVSDPRLMPE